MASPDKAKLLSQTLDRLRAKHKPGAGDSAPAADITTEPPTGPDIFHADTVLREFVRSFLIWESSVAKADAALKRIASAVVDINEFRVCLPIEMAAIIGSTYPRVEERVVRLRWSLNEIFKRENRLKLSHLPGLSKKASNAYLSSLAHAPAFVADRIALLCCQSHALPVDSRIAAVLEKARVIDKGVTPEDAAPAVTRLLKAGEAREAYTLLQEAADLAPVTPTRVPKAPKPKQAKAAPAAPRAAARKPRPAARKGK